VITPADGFARRRDAVPDGDRHHRFKADRLPKGLSRAVCRRSKSYRANGIGFHASDCMSHHSMNYELVQFRGIYQSRQLSSKHAETTHILDDAN
jgi:hypothetical protein